MLRVTGLLLNVENSHTIGSYMNNPLPPEIELPPHLMADFTYTLDAMVAVDNLMEKFIANAQKKLIDLREKQIGLLDRSATELGLSKEDMVKYYPVRIQGGCKLVMCEGCASGEHQHEEQSTPPVTQLPTPQNLPAGVQELFTEAISKLGLKGVKIGKIELQQMVQIHPPVPDASPAETPEAPGNSDETGEQTHTA